MAGFPGSVLLTGQDINQTTSDKRYPLGTRGYTRDGRCFRYARNGATALIPAHCVTSAGPLAGALYLTTGTTKAKANSTGPVTLLHGTTGVFTTINAFADGYLFNFSTSTARGMGAYAQIKSHTTQTATSTAGKVSFYFHSGSFLYSGTTVNGTTNADFGVVRNPYDKVIRPAAGAVTAPVVGVSIRAVAANYYFWLQTWGPCPVRNGTVAVKVGTAVAPSTATTGGRISGITSTKYTSTGTVATWTFFNQLAASFGVTMHVGVSGEARMVFLKCAP